MSFSYTGPANSPSDAVRFTIGDTHPKTARLSDEEIAYLLAETGGDVNMAARRGVEAIIATLSSLCDQSVGSVSKSYSQMRDGWQATLALLKDRTVFRGGLPLVGGISRTAERTAEQDRDLLRPQFKAKMLRRHADCLREVHGLGPAAIDDEQA